MSDLASRPPADHSVKIPHLVFALLFLGAAGIWALVVTEVITEDRLPIVAPAVLIVAGVIGLAVSLASTRNRRQRLARQHPDTEAYAVDEPASYEHQAHETAAYEHQDDATTLDQTREIR